jgi:hypothetical protein
MFCEVAFDTAKADAVHAREKDTTEAETNLILHVGNEEEKNTIGMAYEAYVKIDNREVDAADYIAIILTICSGGTEHICTCPLTCIACIFCIYFFYPDRSRIDATVNPSFSPPAPLSSRKSVSRLSFILLGEID